MRVILIFLVLVVLVQSDLKSCIQEKCPDQFAKCEDQSGCEDKLWKCEDKCGAKVDILCWTFCLGGPGVPANVAICAVN